MTTRQDVRINSDKPMGDIAGSYGALSLNRLGCPDLGKDSDWLQPLIVKNKHERDGRALLVETRPLRGVAMVVLIIVS